MNPPTHLRLPTARPTGRHLVVALPEGLDFCEYCGVGYVPKPKARKNYMPRRFCDDICRRLAARVRDRAREAEEETE